MQLFLMLKQVVQECFKELSDSLSETDSSPILFSVREDFFLFMCVFEGDSESCNLVHSR
jgi:hypothetical protein